MDVQVNYDNTVRRIMLLSHELGREISTDDVVRWADIVLNKLSKEKPDVTIEFSYNYIIENLEKKYREKYGN